jgi:predicted ribosomally synthesized peptide with SipW-like signal peptide
MLKKKLVMAVFTAIFGASLIGAGTSAIYTSQADNTGNTFASGTLVVELDKDSTQGEHYFDVDNMAPGDTEEAIMTVSNTGSLDLRFDLSHTFDINVGTLGNALEVKYYTHDGNAWVEVTNPTDANIEVASLSSVDVKVEVTLPLSTNDDYQGESTMMKIQVDAEQVKNNPIVPAP